MSKPVLYYLMRDDCICTNKQCSPAPCLCRLTITATSFKDADSKLGTSNVHRPKVVASTPGVQFA